MQLNITEKKDNLLLERVEVLGTITFEGVTPSNSEVTEAIAKALKSDASLVVLKGIHTKFSEQVADVIALVYKTAEAKAKFETVTKHVKKKAEEVAKAAAEEKKEEAAPKEEAKAEPEAAPAEEKTEEASAPETPEEVKEEASE